MDKIRAVLTARSPALSARLSAGNTLTVGMGVAGASTWIEVPTEDLYVGGTEPTAQHTIWLEVSE